MQKAILMLMAVLFAAVSHAQSVKKETITVSGNCGMCKKRIESAIKADVKSARWSADTKKLTVSYDPTVTSIDKIQEKIAAVGHDTEKKKADAKAYDKLPGCCHYPRN